MEHNTHDTAANEEQKQLQQFITFTVLGQEYGIDIMSIREIKGWTETTSLPNSPRYMRGVINLRGTVVPIMDLRARFNMGETETSKNHVVMIVTIGSRLMGILVDSVSDILTVDKNEIRAVPDVEGSHHGDILSGLVSLENRMVALLILEKLFDMSIIFSSEHTQFFTEECANTSTSIDATGTMLT